ncbi:unnamed protein product [Boreogadus saida]
MRYLVRSRPMGYVLWLIYWAGVDSVMCSVASDRQSDLKSVSGFGPNLRGQTPPPLSGGTIRRCLFFQVKHVFTRSKGGGGGCRLDHRRTSGGKPWVSWLNIGCQKEAKWERQRGMCGRLLLLCCAQSARSKNKMSSHLNQVVSLGFQHDHRSDFDLSPSRAAPLIAQWLRRSTASRKVPGSIPDVHRLTSSHPRAGCPLPRPAPHSRTFPGSDGSTPTTRSHLYR